jgi:hypothetical protein
MAYYSQSQNPETPRVGLLTQDYAKGKTTLSINKGEEVVVWQLYAPPLSNEALRKVYNLTELNFDWFID